MMCEESPSVCELWTVCEGYFLFRIQKNRIFLFGRLKNEVYNLLFSHPKGGFRHTQALQVPWIRHILQPSSRRLRHQVPHSSSHQSVWSPNQILEQPDVDTYTNTSSSVFRAIPMNLLLLLWGCEAWSLRKSLLIKLEVFLQISVASYKYLCSKSREKELRTIKSENDSMTYHV